MAFLSGVFVIDCPASALNNSGKFPFLPMDASPSNDENWVAVKKVHTRQGTFPYVSAQAFRSWLRESLKGVHGWKASPVFREEKVAYTDANPIEYAEDDLFGYMRAPAGVKPKEREKKEAAWKEEGLNGQEFKEEREKVKFAALTRSSPFRVSTLVSVGPVKELGHDYGNMARHTGDPVPYEHEFYRTALVGLLSLDLRMVGRFYHVDRTGYRHLDSVRKEMAEKKGLKTYDEERAHELALEERTNRVRQLLDGLARLSGGAKMALHYTDVTPRFVLLGVTQGGNHLFGTALGAGRDGEPLIHLDALTETASVYRSELLSGLYAGLAKGYLDGQREGLEKTLWKLAGEPMERDDKGNDVNKVMVVHPVEAIRALSEDIGKKAAEWLA